MGDGRTPTITVVGAASEGTVVFVDAASIWPFPELLVDRQSERRDTREASTGAGKTYERFKLFNDGDLSFDFAATLDASEAAKLYAISKSNPPLCGVTYASGSSLSITFNATLKPYRQKCDVGGENDAGGPNERIVSGTFNGVST